MAERIKLSLSSLLAYLAKLSVREKVIIGVAALLVSIALVSKSYDWVSNRFSDQIAELEQAEKDLQAAAVMLQKHAKLRGRRDQIEAMYKEIEIKEGGLSLLERLLRTRASVTSGFTIKDGQIRQFGGNYEQAPFSVKFPITNLSNLVAFLDEVINGPQRMVLTRLDIRKGRGTDRLEVDMDVTSFRRIK